MRINALNAIAVLHGRFGGRARLNGNTLELMGSDVGCHVTANGTRPVHVTPAPDGNGLLVTCFGCGNHKEAYRLIIEALGDLVRLGGGRPQHYQPVAPRKVYYATAIEGPVTTADVLKMALWILTLDKRPAWCAKGVWRASLQQEYGGVRRARFGGPGPLRPKDGEAREAMVLPWTPWETVNKAILKPGLLVPNEAEPTLALAGDQDMPAPHDLLLLDFDYKPSEDPDGQGLALREATRERFDKAGFALFGSRSGNGFHALGRYSGEDMRLGRWPQVKRLDVNGVPGAGLDIFPPGYQGMINLGPARFMPGTDLNQPLPTLGLDALVSLLS